MCQQKSKNSTENVPFLILLHTCKVESILIPSFYCLLTMQKRMAVKGDFLSEFWLSLHTNDDQRKNAKFDNQTYLQASKGPESFQQSTRSLSLCVISMG